MGNLSDFLGGSGGSLPVTALNANETYFRNVSDYATQPYSLSTFALRNGLSLTELTTTDTYQDILNVSGAGVFKFLAISVDGNYAADLDFKIIIDGSTVLTQEGVQKTNARAYVPIGKAFLYDDKILQLNRFYGIGSSCKMGSVEFASSFVVQVKHAVSALNCDVIYDYHLR